MRYKSLEAAAIPIRLTDIDFDPTSPVNHSPGKGAHSATGSTLRQLDVNVDQTEFTSSSDDESNSDNDDYNNGQMATK